MLYSITRVRRIRYDQYGIAVKVCTRQALGYSMVDTDSIRAPSTYDLTTFLTLVVDSKFGDLEPTTMRVTNQNYLLSILIGLIVANGRMTCVACLGNAAAFR
jgi:hypothetical protein